MMEFLSAPEFWTDLWWNLFHLLRKVFLVLMPIVVVLEFLRTTKVFSWLIERLHRGGRLLGYQKESLFPLLTGIVFGITLGAGVLIAEAKTRGLSRRQTLLIGTFLSICHAIFEDTLVFMVVGASGLVMLGTRIPAAILIVFVLSLLLRSGWWPRQKAASSTK
ncbi:nucleoside recognition domain-containing protein [Candidatus Zixiibacteriota bacterium]